MAPTGYYQRSPRGYQQLTVSSTAVSLTIPAGKRVTFALVRCSTANVRYRDDGTDPTATVGEPLLAGEVLEYDANVAAVKFIRQSADATLDISYYE